MEEKIIYGFVDQTFLGISFFQDLEQIEWINQFAQNGVSEPNKNLKISFDLFKNDKRKFIKYVLTLTTLAHEKRHFYDVFFSNYYLESLNIRLNNLVQSVNFLQFNFKHKHLFYPIEKLNKIIVENKFKEFELPKPFIDNAIYIRDDYFDSKLNEVALRIKNNNQLFEKIKKSYNVGYFTDFKIVFELRAILNQLQAISFIFGDEQSNFIAAYLFEKAESIQKLYLYLTHSLFNSSELNSSQMEKLNAVLSFILMVDDYSESTTFNCFFTDAIEYLRRHNEILINSPRDIFFILEKQLALSIDEIFKEKIKKLNKIYGKYVNDLSGAPIDLHIKDYLDEYKRITLKSQKNFLEDPNSFFSYYGFNENSFKNSLWAIPDVDHYWTDENYMLDAKKYDNIDNIKLINKHILNDGKEGVAQIRVFGIDEVNKLKEHNYNFFLKLSLILCNGKDNTPEIIRLILEEVAMKSKIPLYELEEW